MLRPRQNPSRHYLSSPSIPACATLSHHPSIHKHIVSAEVFQNNTAGNKERLERPVNESDHKSLTPGELSLIANCDPLFTKPDPFHAPTKGRVRRICGILRRKRPLSSWPTTRGQIRAADDEDMKPRERDDAYLAGKKSGDGFSLATLIRDRLHTARSNVLTYSLFSRWELRA